MRFKVKDNVLYPHIHSLIPSFTHRDPNKFCADRGNRTPTPCLASTRSTTKLCPLISELYRSLCGRQLLLYSYCIGSRGEMDITAVFGTAIPGSNPGGSS